MRRVFITRAALVTIRREARVASDGRETGGVLIGVDLDQPSNLEVRLAGGPGPRAQRRADFFKRDLIYSQHLADAAFLERGWVWIGDWHTHPAGYTRPSPRDLRTYAEFLSDPDLGFEVFLAIVAIPHPKTKWDDPLLNAWTVTEGALFNAELRVTERPYGSIGVS